MEAARPTTGPVNSDQGCIKGGIAGLTARAPGDARARAGRTPAGATEAGQGPSAGVLVH